VICEHWRRNILAAAGVLVGAVILAGVAGVAGGYL
jgi:hypothetical protein